jgi:hypothetical protein
VTEEPEPSALDRQREALRRAAPDPAPGERRFAHALASELRFALGFGLVVTAVILVVVFARVLWER